MSDAHAQTKLDEASASLAAAKASLEATQAKQDELASALATAETAFAVFGDEETSAAVLSAKAAIERGKLFLDRDRSILNEAEAEHAFSASQLVAAKFDHLLSFEALERRHAEVAAKFVEALRLLNEAETAALALEAQLVTDDCSRRRLMGGPDYARHISQVVEDHPGTQWRAFRITSEKLDFKIPSPFDVKIALNRYFGMRF